MNVLGQIGTRPFAAVRGAAAYSTAAAAVPLATSASETANRGSSRLLHHSAPRAQHSRRAFSAASGSPSTLPVLLQPRVSAELVRSPLSKSSSRNGLHSATWSEGTRGEGPVRGASRFSTSAGSPTSWSASRGPATRGLELYRSRFYSTDRGVANGSWSRFK